MWFEVKMAGRFLRSAKMQTFLILLGIIVGVTVQVFLGSLIQGLQQNLIEQTVGSAPHIFVLAEDESPRRLVSEQGANSRVITFTSGREGISRWQELEDSLKDIAGIDTISATIDGSGFALRGQKSLQALIRGVDFAAADQIYNLRQNIVSGEANLGGNNILIGRGMANDLELSVGDSINLRTAAGISDSFFVTGIFALGAEELNNSWVFIDRLRAATLLGSNDQISTFELQIEDVFAATTLAEEIRRNNPAVKVESWQENNQDLLTALRSQSSSSLVIQVFVMIAVTLGIASVLAVSVVQKSRQIGILKAMGTNQRRVGLIFLIQGAILGLVGAILGSLSGIGLSQLFVNLVRDEAGNPLFPIEVDLRFIIISIIVATLAGMIAALIPAWNSAKLNPIEVIRNG